MKNKHVKLAIETNIRGGSIAVYQEYSETKCVVGDSSISNSREILQLIERLLRENDIDKKTIGTILISEGFGSFTGSRIGWSTAKALSQVFLCELKGVSLLEAICLSSSLQGRTIVCLPMGKTKFVVGEYEPGNTGTPKFLNSPEIISLEHFQQIIKQNLDKIILVENDLFDSIESGNSDYSRLIQLNACLASYLF